MFQLFGRPFGGKPPSTGRFDPSSAEDDEGTKPGEAPAAEDDDEDEGDEDSPVVVEDDDEDDETATDDEGDKSAVAAERSRWVTVLSQIDMPAGACAAVEALAEGLSPEASLRIANRSGSAPVAPKPSPGAALAERRSKRPAVPQSGGGKSDPGAERRSRIGARLDAAGHVSKKGKP